MTVYEEEIEVRRPSVGTKVLVLACAIMAVLGSFWGIVWFIRAYVEPPRVMIPAPITLASRESTPAPTPASDTQPVAEAQAAPAADQPAAAAPAPAQPAIPAPRDAAAEQPNASGAVADRWAPMNQFALPPAVVPAPSAAPTESAPAALATETSGDIEEVAEGSVPAIAGPAPLPRRRPLMTASMKRSDPPLPRPRPDAAGAAAGGSVWIAVPTSDDRYQAGQQ